MPGRTTRRPTTSRSVRVVGASVPFLLAGLLAGCSGDPDGTASSSTTRAAATTTTAASPDGTTTTGSADPSAPAAAGEPRAGDCLEPLTYDLTSSPQLPAVVPCDQPHGGEVVAVYQFPPGVGDEYPALSGRITGAPAASSACLGDDADDLGDFAKFAGDNRLVSPKSGGSAEGSHEAWLVSSIEGVLFVPRPGAWTSGARWVACAAVVRSSTTELNTYEGTAKGALAPGKLAEQFGWCRTAVDQENRYDVVRCNRPHTTEQLASFRVGADRASYPGDAEIGKLAEGLCPKLASLATGGRSERASPDRFGISWTYPVADSWADGDRTARCYINSLENPITGSFAAGTAQAD